MDPVKFVVPNAVERQSFVYTATLQDEGGVPLSYLAVDSLTLTLYDLNTNAIINSRSSQNALNANQVSLDAAGNLKWQGLPADGTFINPNKPMEEHVALFTVKWTDGLGRPHQANHEVHFLVNRIPNST